MLQQRQKAPLRSALRREHVGRILAFKIPRRTILAEKKPLTRTLNCVPRAADRRAALPHHLGEVSRVVRETRVGVVVELNLAVPPRDGFGGALVPVAAVGGGDLVDVLAVWTVLRAGYCQRRISHSHRSVRGCCATYSVVE